MPLRNTMPQIKIALPDKSGVHCQICNGVSPESKARAYFLEGGCLEKKRESLFACG